MKMTIKKNVQNTSKPKGIRAASQAKSDYEEAAEYIQCAISVLGKAARRSDVLASESIANLSVVLMDLK